MPSQEGPLLGLFRRRWLRLVALFFVLGSIAIGVLVACSTTTTERLGLPPLTTVERVELERYLGTWYEIGSYPQRFQKGCEKTTATYSLKENGDIKVVNRCWRNGAWDEAVGNAVIENSESNAELSVSFFWPFYGDYWVISLDRDYQWAVVGHPSRDYLWILSRTPEMPNATLDMVLKEIEQKHKYPLEPLKFTRQ
ncbi:MAG: lipocalin family protein [Planctomycetes bacterium]|nr:lipocalin family protein [Planctomycetota bacterium]